MSQPSFKLYDAQREQVEKSQPTYYYIMKMGTGAQKSINWTIFIQLIRRHLRYDCDYKN